MKFFIKTSQAKVRGIPEDIKKAIQQIYYEAGDILGIDVILANLIEKRFGVTDIGKPLEQKIVFPRDHGLSGEDIISTLEKYGLWSFSNFYRSFLKGDKEGAESIVLILARTGIFPRGDYKDLIKYISFPDFFKEDLRNRGSKWGKKFISLLEDIDLKKMLSRFSPLVDEQEKKEGEIALEKRKEVETFEERAKKVSELRDSLEKVEREISSQEKELFEIKKDIHNISTRIEYYKSMGITTEVSEANLKEKERKRRDLEDKIGELEEKREKIRSRLSELGA